MHARVVLLAGAVALAVSSPAPAAKRPMKTDDLFAFKDTDSSIRPGGRLTLTANTPISVIAPRVIDAYELCLQFRTFGN